VLGEADRAATPLGGIEAVAASWTIESEEEGACCTGRRHGNWARQTSSAARLGRRGRAGRGAAGAALI
jgi:hypothetical protein